MFDCLQLGLNSPHSQGLGCHVCLIHHRVGVDHPEGSKQEDQEVLAVEREAGHQSVDGLHLLSLVLHLDDVKDGGLVIRSKYSAWNLPEELLHHAGDGVQVVVLDVDEATLERS